MIAYILAFLAGLLVKFVDWMDDERKTDLKYKLPLAVLYGLIIGYIISQSTFSMLFLGALCAQILARKIDTLSHRVGFIISLLSLLYFGFPGIDLSVFLAFLILAFLDEMDYIGWMRPLVEYRPFLKLGAFVLGIAGVWDYFFGIILFDIGYLIAEEICRRKMPVDKNLRILNPKKR